MSTQHIQTNLHYLAPQKGKVKSDNDDILQVTMSWVPIKITSHKNRKKSKNSQIWNFNVDNLVNNYHLRIEYVKIGGKSEKK